MKMNPYQLAGYIQAMRDAGVMKAALASKIIGTLDVLTRCGEDLIATADAQGEPIESLVDEARQLFGGGFCEDVEVNLIEDAE